MGLKCCPHCKGTGGYKQTLLIAVDRHTMWDGTPVGDDIMHIEKEYKTLRCNDCGKAVTSHVNAPEFKL